MKTVVIANPRASASRVHQRWDTLNSLLLSQFGTSSEVHFTESRGDATRLCRRAIAQSASRIVCVGGDGTFNEVINGFFDESGLHPIGGHVTLAFCPVGTGGDFAKSAGMPPALSTKQAAYNLDAMQAEHIDLGQVSFVDRHGRTMVRYFANVCSVGLGGFVSHTVNGMSKRLGGRASFLLGTLRGLLCYRNQRVRLSVESGPTREMVMSTIAVANGRYFGGGMKIAPHALLNDGMFHVTVVGDIDLSAFIRYAPSLYRGEHLSKPEVDHFVARSLSIEPLDTTPVLIDMDGEQPGQLPAQFKVLPKAIKLLAPWNRAEAYF